ncbi:hypothetical protein Tco_0374199 [Tanacetum coccineum]
MTTLQFADTYNLVVFLTKSSESEGFEQIVDFLNAKTVNGEVQLQALVDGKKIVVTEASVRRDLQLEDANGVDCLPMLQFLNNLHLWGMSSHKRIYVTPSHTKKIVANMRRKGKHLSGRETPLFPTMGVQVKRKWVKEKDTEILQSSVPSDPINIEDEAVTESLEDASKQGRKIDDIDADAEISLVDESQGRHDDDLIFDTVTTAGEVVTTANVEVSTASPTAATITNVELTLAQILAELKSARPKTKGVVIQDSSESTPTISLQLQSQSLIRESTNDGDDVTIDATPLTSKSPTIVDYKIYKEGKKSYF